MKFLCPSCKAKYQIADEKVAGRTLRMNCRQCKEEIVIRGDAVATASASPAAMPAPAGVPNRLGMDFQRQVAAGPASTDPGAFDEWHVAINDIPVGPMRRDEVARKIAMGAVGPDSLAWREGLDDWLPVRHIAELAVLCQPSTVAPLPTGPVTPAPHGSAVPPAAPAPPPPVAMQPSMRSPAAPMGGRMGASAMEDFYSPSTDAGSQPASHSMTRSYTGDLEAVPRPSSSAPGWGPMFLLVCGGAFILAMGALLGRMLLPTDPAQQAMVPQPTVAEPARPAAEVGGEALAEDEDTASAIELDLQEIDGNTVKQPSAQRAGTGKATKPTESATKNTKQLSAEEQAKLARMREGLNTPVGTLRKTNGSGSSGSIANRSELTASQISKVVSKGKKDLQRCYEVAMRGSGSDDAVRMDVELSISESGNVKSAKTTGKGLPGMSQCISRTVRMWRFPASSGPTDTKFPLVFQPGA